MSDGIQRSAAVMGTVVTIHLIGTPSACDSSEDCKEAAERALNWFYRVEQCCSRFDHQSELMQLCRHVEVPVPASPLLYEAVQFALTVAEESGGAFDPTVGHAMENRGFNREHRTGRVVKTSFVCREPASYRDVQLDPKNQTITLLRPLLLDLGAVAKGMAVDLAARELRDFRNFAINAGGDLFLGGTNASAEIWNVGIRHPRVAGELIDRIRVSDRAVCTSGDYERRNPHTNEHHILDPRPGSRISDVASVTVIGPTAMSADALATAAFVLGHDEGIRFLERVGVEGLIISTSLDCYRTRGMCAYQ